MMNLIKQNKWKLLISSLVLLLPVLAALLLKGSLPENAPIHWGPDGVADGWGNPLTVVFIATPILLILHWVCVLTTAYDNRKNNRNL